MRHDDVVVQLERRDGAKRVRRLAAHAPECLAFLFASRAQHLQRADVAAGRDHRVGLRLHRRRGAVHLNQQERPGALGRETLSDVRRHGVERVAIHQFQRRRDDTPAHERADGPRRGANVRKARAQRGDRGRLRHQPKRDLRDDRERSLRSHEQLREVVAHDVLHGAAARADDLPGRQHGLQAEHVALRDAGFERPRTTGALRDVAAYRRLLSDSVDRADKTPLRLDGQLQFTGDHGGLDDRKQVVSIDLDDAIEAFDAEDDTALSWDGAS